LRLDGSILANGGTNFGGGGAGVSINVNKIEGRGQILSKGGSGSTPAYGGGCGGRIAAYARDYWKN
jgi:hypothetical protein